MKAKWSKELVERSVQQRRCRVKMPMIGRLKPSDIPPSLPSLGLFKDYIDAEAPDDDTPKTCEFLSSVPLEGQIQIQPSSLQDVQTSEVVDLDMEMDIENVHVDVQGLKHEHKFQADFSEVSRKKKKIDDKPASDTTQISPWQNESIVEVPYVDLSVDVPQIHTFANVHEENVQKEQSTLLSRNMQKCNVDKIDTVQVKEEVLSCDDDVVVTFVEHGFPKCIKQETQSASTITRPMKLISMDTGDQEYQCRVQILAEVHRPQETRHNQSIVDHDYLPQNIVEDWKQVHLEEKQDNKKCRE